METSRRHTTQEQREFERIKKNVTVGDRTAEPATSTAQAQPTRQNQGGTYSLTLQYNGANVNSNTSKIDFLDTGTFVSANITFRITKVGAKTTVEAYGNGFLPDGTIHQTLRHTTGTAKEWIANDRLRNRGDSNHTYAANEGAVEIKSFGGETGTALRVLGIAGSNVYGIYADTDNQTAIRGEATGTGYGIYGWSNTGTAIYGESTTGYALHGVSANDAIYGSSTNGFAVFAVSSGNDAVRAESSDAFGWGVQAYNNEDFASSYDGGGVRGTADGNNGTGVFGGAYGSFGNGVYGEASGSGIGVVAKNADTNGLALYAEASGSNGVAISAYGDLYAFQTTGAIDVGDGYCHGGVKVVGAQGAAVADATGAGDVVAQLNALLARMRTHGLIAP